MPPVSVSTSIKYSFSSKSASSTSATFIFSLTFPSSGGATSVSTVPSARSGRLFRAA